jgi:hypothetical protein
MNEQADILMIAQLIGFGRHWRDTGQWENMRDAYQPDSRMRVAWFQGTGPEFVEASTGLDVIYEKDTLAPVNPADRLEIDRAELIAYRPSYRFISYTLRRIGRPINLHLAGDDRPELVAAVYAEADAWLSQRRWC